MNALPLQWTIEVNPNTGTAAAFHFEADAGELERLKNYVEVEDLLAFSADIKILPLAQGKVRAVGSFEAKLVQASVINLEPLSASVSDSFSVEYWPPEAISELNVETIDLETDPPEALVSGRVPIGALLSELLAISVDPYPRAEGDVFEWSDGTWASEESPFAELVRLRKPDGPGKG
jgi:hypothetical protein